MGKYIIWEASMLTDVYKGIHTKWTYFNDGSMETSYFLGSAPVLYIPLSV